MDKRFSSALSTPQSRTLVEYELCLSLEWLCRLRWIAGAGVILATWFARLALGLELAVMPLTVIGVGILVYNVLFIRWLNRLTCDLSGANVPARTQARAQIAADWIAIILLIHYSGGIESPAILYFFFHIILATILLSVHEAYFVAGLAIVLVGGLAGLEYGGWIPHVTVGGLLPVPLYARPLYVGSALVFFASAVIGSVYLATRTTGRLRKREAEIVALSQDLQRAYNRLHMLYESAQTVNSTLELQEVLDRLTRSTAEVMGVKACTIRLLEAGGQSLCLASTYGLPDAYFQKGCLLVDQNPLVREVLTGKVVAVDDIAGDTRLQYPEAALAEGIHAILTAPLIGHQGPLGIIRVYCEKPYCFSDDDKQYLATVASHGSIALENALAYAALRDLDAAKRKFILTVTHELRSPVGVVRSLLRTLAGGYAGALTDVQADMIARALRRTDFLQTLIDDLLDLAAGKAGLRMEETLQSVNLNQIITRVIERYTVPAAEKHLTLQLDLPDVPLHIMGVAEQLDRAFNNLVSNAVKYTPAEGQITVRLQEVEGQAQCTISDTGIGIPEEAQPHLFEEFYRAPNAKTQVKEGTGLGLVITKDILTRYGCTIRVKSGLGEGTTFTVACPLAPEESSD
ncbi:MAG TPA: GAF domain-containing sensor histidine kinase [Anaerolineae bacterium]|nr:GAF domain-containing sensor histidine kinase [Anaerolineae bacterium]HQK14858.1 GAF domain-containing sensor histidine kinase [Anaerolineae bacterium]